MSYHRYVYLQEVEKIKREAEAQSELEHLRKRVMELEVEVEHWKQEFKYINQCEKGLYGMRLERDLFAEKLNKIKQILKED